MSECTHNCETCGVEGCHDRIEKVKLNEESKVKKTIAIVSGKGGVGKTFVTSLLAAKLAKDGNRVGILDGDIVGPSVPNSFNVHEQAYGNENQHIVPAMTASGIKLISSNFLLENEEDPIIWRGGLVSTLLKQFYTDVAWGELEYLLIDMPPGTSDVTLTAFQSIPLDGIIIVTSPQDLVSLIVKKAINMAKMMNIPIIGVIENMSYVECPNCDEHIEIYGPSRLDEFAKETETKPLTRLPIRQSVANLIDVGDAEEIVDLMPEISEATKVIEEL